MLQNANNEKEYLRYKLKESNMRIRNHKGSIMTFTQKLKTKKKQITKLEKQNVSHLEEKLRLKHEIAWLTDKLENKNIPGVKLSINESPDIEDHDHSSFTVISHKKRKTTNKIAL